MKFNQLVLAALLLLSVGGAFISRHLTALHTAQPDQMSQDGWFADACNPEINPGYDCDAVVRTKWGVFSFSRLSFVEPDPETGAQAGTPVALLGWVYFSVVFVWYALLGRCDYRRRRLHLALLLMVAATCLASAFYLYLLLTQMEEKCIWCMRLHFINFALLIGTLILLPRKPASAEDEQTDATEPYPGPRLIAAAAVCAAAVAMTEVSIAQRDQHEANSAQNLHELAAYKAEVERVHSDINFQLLLYQAQKPVRISVRPDEIRPGQEDAPLRLVVFSDYDCTACRRLARDIEEDIAPSFNDRLQVIWKHLPSGSECNPHLVMHDHADSCAAAYAVEAARIQGDDAAWRAHEALSAAQRKLADVDYERFAEELGLDPQRFIEDMNSETVRRRVLNDADLAHSLGVISTPTLFLEGKTVPRRMLYQEPFVNALKARLLSDHPDTIPDSPSRSDAP